LEQKISDAEPSDQRVDPHALTPVRKAMQREGQIAIVRRAGIDWYTLPHIHPDLLEMRLTLQSETFIALSQRSLSQRVGQTLEIATYKALLQLENGVFFGRFKDLEEHDDDQIKPSDTKPVRNKVDTTLGQRLIDLRERIVSHFDAGNWEELGLLTECSDFIKHHSRLLRSLSWGDEDYAGNVLTVLRQIVEYKPKTVEVIESYLDRKFPGESHFISAKPSERKITFAPNAFQVPDSYVQLYLVAVMMPFAAELCAVYEAIRRACASNTLECLRVDDIWEESAIIQDIFN